MKIQREEVYRELVNTLFLIVLAGFLHVVLDKFRDSLALDYQLWSTIWVGMALTLSGYAVFRFMLFAQRRDREWRAQVGTPASMMYDVDGGKYYHLLRTMLESMKPDDEVRVIAYYGRQGGIEDREADEAKSHRTRYFDCLLDLAQNGKIQRYERVICFDKETYEQDVALKRRELVVGKGPGTVTRHMAEHCERMKPMERCSVQLAPARFNADIVMLGNQRIVMSVDTVDHDTGIRKTAGALVFSSPPNEEIVRTLRRIIDDTRKHAVALERVSFENAHQANGGRPHTADLAQDDSTLLSGALSWIKRFGPSVLRRSNTSENQSQDT